MLKQILRAMLVLSLLVAGAAQAQEEERTIQDFIGIIDMRGVLEESNAIATIRDTLDEQNTLFQARISSEEIALRDAEKRLNEEKDLISEEAFNARLAGFEQQVIRMQRSIQAQKSSFDRAYAEAQGRLERELLQIISEISRERGFVLVLQRKDALIYDASLDISAEALERLNERTKNLTITLEKKEAQ